ncbi:MAG: NUDIX domain-containing protein [Corallococcus sp.]|nr:NUDIX domain-containing protein [Corallococcus sp.]
MDGKTVYREEYSAMAVVLCGNEILTTVEDIFGNLALSLPKGHVESGETAMQTAVRECREETGIIVTPSDVVYEAEGFSYEFTNKISGVQVRKTIYPVVFVLDKKQIPQISESRVKSVSYMDIDEFAAKCSYDNVRQVVCQVKSHVFTTNQNAKQ